jgi:hypothetical protein
MWRKTPILFRRLFLGGKPRSVKRAVKILANHLDWFLDPPRLYLRRSWFALLLCLAILAALFAPGLGINIQRTLLTTGVFTLGLMLHYYRSRANLILATLIYQLQAKISSEGTHAPSSAMLRIV